MNNHLLINHIAKQTEDALSRTRYGEEAWRNAIRLLLTYRYTPEQIIEILMSKYMRWAADAFAKADKNDEDVCTGEEIIKYKRKWGIEVKELMK